MAVLNQVYLNENKSIVPVTDIGVVDAHILAVYLYLIEEVCAVHEMVFGDVKGKSVD